jgi:putative transposase
MSQRVDAALVQEVLQRALGRRQPAKGLMHHSDCGSRYACGAYQAMLAARGIRCRMSRKGERMALHYYATHREARDDVIDDFELFYNSKRWHSYPGCVSTNGFAGLAKAA